MRFYKAGPGDVFAQITHRMIVRDGGPGNWAALRVLLSSGTIEADSVWRRWHALTAGCPLLRSQWFHGLRGCGWRLPGLLQGDQHLRPPMAVALQCQADGQGHELILRWDHRVADVRAALQVLQALADDQSLSAMLDADHTQRSIPSLPATARERSVLARSLPALMKPFRGGHWQPRRCPGAALYPLSSAQAIISGADWQALQQRQRQVSGRFGESAFYLAAVARALYRAAGARGRLIFPLAVDLRGPDQRWSLINGHGFMFCTVDAALAHHDMAAASAAIAQGQKRWLEAEGARAILAGIGFAPWVPWPLVRQELGFRGPGLGASAICGWSGLNALPTQLAGCSPVGVDHQVVPMAAPGLAILMHRDLRGWVADVHASAAVEPACPPQRVAEALRHGLLDD